MDSQALILSLQLAAATLLVLLPLGILLGRWLATRQFAGKIVIETALAMPLVLPPTVIGYFLLVSLGAGSRLGQWYTQTFGQSLVFHFSGLLLASVLVNLPFAIQPAQRAFEAISQDVRDAAKCCGMSFWRALWHIELPLAWPGVLTGMTLTFAHTLGEFGVVLMVGGSIPGETQTISISIYDRVQALDFDSARQMSLLLLAISFGLLLTVSLVTRYSERRHEARDI